MTRVVVFGNSGSGKSTLALRLARELGIRHLDLDTVAWKPDQPGVREAFEKSRAALEAFFAETENWIVEGCYASLLALAAERATRLVFLNPGVPACQRNCGSRPWEPHKYASKSAQDKNLAMLLDWVAGYDTRTDEFSLQAHRELFDAFAGPKFELAGNEETRRFSLS